jgi:hypothetical protein
MAEFHGLRSNFVFHFRDRFRTPFKLDRLDYRCILHNLIAHTLLISRLDMPSAQRRTSADFVGAILCLMANPLPPGFWDDYRKRIEADIASLRRDLDPLESGEMHLRSIGTDGVMHDVTESWISHFRRTIKNYQSILDALKKSELQ